MSRARKALAALRWRRRGGLSPKHHHNARDQAGQSKTISFMIMPPTLAASSELSILKRTFTREQTPRA